ncbi:MAG: uracil phosphoribosyltransferase [Verrucomicrobiales bacterium]
MPALHVSAHPIIRASLNQLRDKASPPAVFRDALTRITRLLAYEATAALETVPQPVETPLAVAAGCRLARPVALIPILRAGLGMVPGFLDVIPDTSASRRAAIRDEATALAHRYYCKLPPNLPECDAIILDPMLATGGSRRRRHFAQGKRCPIDPARLPRRRPARRRCLAAKPPRPPDLRRRPRRWSRRTRLHRTRIGRRGDRFFGTI